jgi:hypothetical protein
VQLPQVHWAVQPFTLEVSMLLVIDETSMLPVRAMISLSDWVAQLADKIISRNAANIERVTVCFIDGSLYGLAWQ